MDSASPQPSLAFTCNLCGAQGEAPRESFDRETRNCSACGSTVRLRGLVAMLSKELFGVAMPLPDFPVMKGLRVLGMSDPPVLAERLAQKFDYINTFYHQPPTMDVTQPATEDLGRYDFIVSSEVMEHVPPPVEAAFANLHRMLKPNGLLLLTVPYKPDPGLDEHFQSLHQYALTSLGGRTVLVNRRADGAVEVFEDLCFHGGDGSTLELRVFTEDALKSILMGAGFDAVHVASEDVGAFGVRHIHPWSLPIVARKGRLQAPIGELAGLYLDAQVAGRTLASELERSKQAVREMEQSLRDKTTHWEARATQLEMQVEQWQAEVDRVSSEKRGLSHHLDQLNHETAARNANFREQHELHLKRIEELDQLLRERVEWVRRVEGDSETYVARIGALEAELAQVRAQLKALESRKWVQLGKGIGRL